MNSTDYTLRRPCCGAGIPLFFALSGSLSAAEAGQAKLVIEAAGGLVVTTAVFLGWIYLVWWGRNKLLSRLTDLAFEKTRSITSRNLRRVSFRQLLQLTGLGVRLLSLTLMVSGLLLFVVVILELLPGTQVWADKLELLVMDELVLLGETSVKALPELAIVVVVFFFTRIIHQVLNHFFQSIATGEVRSTAFDPVTAETTRRLGSVGLWICAVIIAFPYLPGSDSAAFRGVTVLTGLMLSIGSANLVTQFTSGLILIYGRALRPGDYVETGQTEGTIEHIGLLACTLRTCRDEIIFLPNATVANGVKNFSMKRGGVRYVATVTIGYDAPWRKVHELLLAAAAATPGIRSAPGPTVLQTALDDFYVRYELQFTPDEPGQRIPLLGRLHEAIQDRFRDAGVQIMSPHYRSDPASPKVPPREGNPPSQSERSC